MLIDACYHATDCIDEDGHAPLEYAEKHGHTKLVEYMKSMTNILFTTQ